MESQTCVAPQQGNQQEKAYIGAGAANAGLSAQRGYEPDVNDVEKIAQMCHEANRVMCVANGDLSQPSWADAPDWQKKSAIDGVHFHITNPYVDGRESHDRWMEVKLRDGWRYGATKNAETKEHPCLLPYRALPDNERIKDDVFRAIVRGYIDGMARIRL